MNTDKVMQYKRRTDGKLELWIREGKSWINYKQHHLYQPDFELSSDSGFRTSQVLLKQGYTFLKTDELV